MLANKSIFYEIVKVLNFIYQTIMNIIMITKLLSLILLMTCLNMQAQDYPFALPDDVTATLTVDSVRQEAFKNQLLGYNIEYFKTSQEKDFIRKFNPVSIRFPHGLWANFYKWQTDGYQNDSYDNGQYDPTIDIYASNVKGHINEIAELNAEKQAKYGRGFNMMWTYSMNFDDAASCVARAVKDSALGLEIKDIELGNEHFWKSQRSNQTKTAADFLNRADSVADALHARFPDVRVSIPLGWRRNQEAYNKSILGDKQYYDAISLHRYMGADPDVPGESNTAYSALLTSRTTLDTDVKWLRSYAGDKPIWLTEWGVSANKEAEVNSAACLGMADVYLYMSENQHMYDRANWFIFNKTLNPMVVVENRKPVYPLKKRGYLSVYEMLQEVFMDGAMLESQMTSTKLNTEVNAVNARVVKKDGMIKVLVVNLANKPAAFKLKFGDEIYNKAFEHYALEFGELGPVPNIDIDADPKVLVKDGTGDITLPPLSLSIITLKENTSRVLGFKNLADGQEIVRGSNLTIEADVDTAYKEVSLWSGDVNLGTLTSAPYQWSSHPILVNMTAPSYTFKLVAKDRDDLVKEVSIEIFTPEVIALASQSSLAISFEDEAIANWETDGTDYDVVPAIVSGTNVRGGAKVMALEFSAGSNGHHVQNLVDKIVVSDQHYFHMIAYTATSDVSFGYTFPTAKLGDWAPTPSFTSHSEALVFERKVTSRQNTQEDSLNCFPRLRSKAQGGACTIYYDDIVLYSSTDENPDLVGPSKAENYQLSPTNVLTWTEGVDALTGVQATLILRTSNASAIAPEMKDQVAYDTTGINRIGDWEVIAVLPASTTSYNHVNEGYEYAIVHRDLAYNYSTALVDEDDISTLESETLISFKCYGNKGRIDLEELKTNTLISIYNLGGIKVFNQKAKSTHLSVDVPQGIYFVKVRDEVTKVVVS